MIFDGNELGSESSKAPIKPYDVCIIGSGPAGISIALQLASLNKRVCLIEAGDDVYSESSQAFYDGLITGEDYDPLDVARLRLFGGTSGHWAGYCSPLDDIDFAARDWIPESGWPIKASDLTGYYEAAKNILDLPEQYSPEDKLVFAGDTITSKQWMFSPPTRFAQKYRDWFRTSSVDLYLNTTVVEFAHSPAGDRVERVTAVNSQQESLVFSADQFVLACGGIENPRILLTASEVFSKQPGGEFIGRYFMEHPHFVDSAQLALFKTEALSSYERSLDRLFYCLQVSPESQHELKLNNMANVLRPLSDSEGHQFPTGSIPLEADVQRFELTTMLEQSPNFDSRVALAQSKDANGIPKVDLQWRTHQRDYESCVESLKFMANQVGRSGIGRMWLSPGVIENSLDQFKYWGHHHMGTTRMSTSAATGVTDQNCRLHGTHNFYVAGSSLYTTVGCANPTFTLVALALRLADHLKVVLK